MWGISDIKKNEIHKLQMQSDKLRDRIGEISTEHPLNQ